MSAATQDPRHFTPVRLGPPKRLCVVSEVDPRILANVRRTEECKRRKALKKRGANSDATAKKPRKAKATPWGDAPEERRRVKKPGSAKRRGKGGNAPRPRFKKGKSQK